MQDKMELDLKDIFKIMYKKRIIIVITTITIAIITAIINLFVLKPVYESTVSIVVGQEDIMENKAYAYSSDTVTLSQKLLKTYSEIAVSDRILKKTVEDLSLDYNYEEYQSFKNRVIVSSKENTQILQISIRDNDPAKAALIANKLTENFMQEGQKFLPQGELKLLDTATVPKNEIKPNKKLNVLVSIILSFIGITTIIVIKELGDLKIVDEDDVEKYLGLKVVGTIRKEDNNQ